MYLRSRSRPLIEFAYETLARNHAWWLRRRDPLGRGLVSYGTSDLGEGLYKGTSFGARNESAMDNSPVHDEATYDPETRTLAAEDVGLNSILALDAEMLALIATELGKSDADAYSRAAETLRAKIQVELWDEQRGIFANRLRSGRFARSLAPTSFYPLLAGAATREQTALLLAHLNSPDKFGGAIGLPGVARDDPAYKDNMYWRGRVWPTFNYLVWQGLRRYGEDDAANALADRGFALFSRSWNDRRLCPENYNAETGEPLDQPDTEGFYCWGALMALLGVGRVMDIGPWRGWEVVNDGEPTRLGPLASPIGQVCVAISEGVLEISRDQKLLLVTNIRGALSHLSFGEGGVSFVLPPIASDDAYVRLPFIDAQDLREALIDNRAVPCSQRQTGISLQAPPCGTRQLVEVKTRPRSA
jgi:putative isomerase